MFSRKPPTSGADEAQAVEQPVQEQKAPFWKAILPVMACGAGLFSDGYINNVRLLSTNRPDMCQVYIALLY
jgi:hypothetical protein